MATSLPTNSSSRPKKKIPGRFFARWRLWVQAAFLLVWLDPLMVRMHTVCSPVFHCYSCPLATFACPIGVLANFSALHTLPLLAIGTLVIGGAVLGSLICGWVCPFGFLQDLLGRIPTPKFAIPGWLGYLRYAVLGGLVIAVPYFYGEGHPLFVCRLCPAGAIEAALPNTVQTAIAGPAVVWPSWAKVSILVVFLVATLFTWRPWCTVLCPLGAIYGLFNRVSLFFVGYQTAGCNDCDVCRGRCRYRNPAQRQAGESRCVRCLECTGCQALTIGTVFQHPLPGSQTPTKGAANSRGANSGEV